MGCNQSKEDDEGARYLSVTYDGKRPLISAPLLQEMELMSSYGRRLPSDGSEFKSQFRTVAEITLDIRLPVSDDQSTEEDDVIRGIFKTGRDRFNFIKTAMMVLSGNGAWNIKDYPINVTCLRNRKSATLDYYAFLMVMEKDGLGHKSSVCGTKSARTEKFAFISLVAEIEHRLAAILLSAQRNPQGPKSEFDAMQEKLQARVRELEQIQKDAGHEQLIKLANGKELPKGPHKVYSQRRTSHMPARQLAAPSAVGTVRTMHPGVQPHYASYAKHADPWTNKSHPMELFTGIPPPGAGSMAPVLSTVPGYPGLTIYQVMQRKEQEKAERVMGLRHVDPKPQQPRVYSQSQDVAQQWPGSIQQGHGWAQQGQGWAPQGHEWVQQGPTWVQHNTTPQNPPWDPRTRPAASEVATMPRRQLQIAEPHAEHSGSVPTTDRKQRQTANDLEEVSSRRSRPKIQVLESRHGSIRRASRHGHARGASRHGSVRAESSRRGVAREDEYEMETIRKLGSSQH